VSRLSHHDQLRLTDGDSAAGLLPSLIDQRPLQEELGVGHATVEAIFRQFPVVAIPGHRKVFVRRADVERFLSQHTYRDGERVRPS